MYVQVLLFYNICSLTYFRIKIFGLVHYGKISHLHASWTQTIVAVKSMWHYKPLVVMQTFSFLKDSIISLPGSFHIRLRKNVLHRKNLGKLSQSSKVKGQGLSVKGLSNLKVGKQLRCRLFLETITRFQAVRWRTKHEMKNNTSLVLRISRTYFCKVYVCLFS